MFFYVPYIILKSPVLGQNYSSVLRFHKIISDSSQNLDYDIEKTPYLMLISFVFFSSSRHKFFASIGSILLKRGEFSVSLCAL